MQNPRILCVYWYPGNSHNCWCFYGNIILHHTFYDLLCFEKYMYHGVVFLTHYTDDLIMLPYLIKKYILRFVPYVAWCCYQYLSKVNKIFCNVYVFFFCLVPKQVWRDKGVHLFVSMSVRMSVHASVCLALIILKRVRITSMGNGSKKYLTTQPLSCWIHI